MGRVNKTLDRLERSSRVVDISHIGQSDVRIGQPVLTAVPKTYDRNYFQTWYHDAGTRIDSSEGLERKVRLAVSVAEYMLGRRIRTVLDVGCGEGRWYPVLRRIRPQLRYQGVDASAYAVRRFGRSRHIRLGEVGALRELRLAQRFDLIVCADMMQYVGMRDLERGLVEMRRLLRGVAYLEAFTVDDAMEGDDAGWHRRSAADYRRLFRRTGFAHCGLHCWIDLKKLGSVNDFELRGASG